MGADVVSTGRVGAIDGEQRVEHRRLPTSTNGKHPAPRPALASLASSLDRFVVRSFDVVGAVALAMLFLPVLVGCALVVKTTSKGPILHRSRRLAAVSGQFDALKFRSMVVDGDDVLAEHFATCPGAQAEYEQEMKLADDPRVTAVGRWLRRRSLDELPQLWNVARGEMSLVGPRPKLPDEHDLYGDAIDLVLSVKPGLTGLWQVSGRSSLSYEQRIALDVAYVRTRTLRGDIAICLRTAVQLVKPDGDQAH